MRTRMRWWLLLGSYCALLLAPVSLARAQTPSEASDGTPSEAPGEEPAQQGSFITIMGGGDGDLLLAVPAFKPGAGATAEMLAAVHAVVLKDLDLIGLFKLLSQDAFIEPLSAGLELGEFSFDDWKLPGASALIKIGISASGGELSASMHAYNVDAGLELGSRDIPGMETDLKGFGHTVANAIVEALTGERGIFHTKIAVIANFGSGKEVYILDYDGSNPRPVSRNGSINLSPGWSPDGTKITYTSYRDNNPDLWMTNLTTGRHIKISAWPGINSGAEWSHDGTEIALTLSKDGDSEIYAIDPDGSILRRLTRQYGIDVSPSYASGDQTLCFVSSRNGNPQIFLMSRDGEVRRLTNRGGHNVAPAWSPDGRKIAFAGRDEGRFDIFVVNVDGTGLRRLTQTGTDDEDPTWSPDGRHIIFTSARDGAGKQLYIMSENGEKPRRLTDGAGSYSNPMWGPDLLGPRTFR